MEKGVVPATAPMPLNALTPMVGSVTARFCDWVETLQLPIDTATELSLSVPYEEEAEL